VRRHPAEVVWLHDVELLAISPLLKLLGQRAIVYDAHEDFANLMLSRDWIPRPLRRSARVLLRGAERTLVRSADALVSVTPGLAHEFSHPQRVVLYNLPTRLFFERAAGAPPPSERPVEVVHLGTLSAERLAFLVDVVLRLAALRGGVRLRVLGVRPDQADWLEQRLPAMVERDVRGTLPYECVPAALSECRLGLDVHPFLHPHLRHALPVKVIEYMAAGCGVVASWLPELARLLPDELDGALNLLPAREASAYAEALAGWLDDPARLDIAAAALRSAAAEHLGWDSQEPKLLELYRSLTG
jgi:glycosyltransferase involved in cell wall biosynthesis